MPLPPLSPAVGGRSIGLSALEPADLIVSTTSARLSRAIRSTTGSAVSHAMLYTGHGQVVEAIGDGVVHRAVAAAVGGGTLAVAFRHPWVTPGMAQAIVSFARSQVGKGYDYRGLAAQAGYRLDRWFFCRVARIEDCDERAARNNLWLASGTQFFCSELVAEAYRQAGLPLVQGSSTSASPQDLVQAWISGALLYVGHLVA